MLSFIIDWPPKCQQTVCVGAVLLPPKPHHLKGSVSHLNASGITGIHSFPVNPDSSYRPTLQRYIKKNRQLLQLYAILSEIPMQKQLFSICVISKEMS